MRDGMWLGPLTVHVDEQKHWSWCAGILASAVLAVNVVVSYQQKLADFLADLASESMQPAEATHKVE